MKTLARTDITPSAHATKFRSDVLKRVRDLDLAYPGSTFEKVLKSYGEDGKYLVLVDGPFSNLPDDAAILTDFIARVRAFRMIQQRSFSPKLALALVRNSLVHSFGLMSSLLWARRLNGRFRDEAVRSPRHQVAEDQNFTFENTFPDPWRGGYHGSFVPGA